MSQDFIAKVHEFNRRFEQAYHGPPRELPASIAALRKKLTLEEATELVLAIDRGELDEMLDACVDLLYVVYGTVLALGMGDVLEEAFNRVHAANMEKVLAPSRHASKRDSAFDIVKPDGWKKADLSDLVRDHV